jgi:hypothetical protein
MGKAVLVSSFSEEFPVQGGQQPGPELVFVPQLVTAGGPDEKGLLHQIAGGRLIPCQAQGEPIQGRMMHVDHLFEIQSRHRLLE